MNFFALIVSIKLGLIALIIGFMAGWSESRSTAQSVYIYAGMAFMLLTIISASQI